MNTSQSTNIQSAVEAEQHDTDDYDTEHMIQSGPNIVKVESNAISHDEHTRYLHYTCIFCHREHTVKLDWKYTVAGCVAIHRHCVTDRKLTNTIIEVRPPQGYKEFWDQGKAVAGRVYPKPFTDSHDTDYQPRQHGRCPTGCITDHDQRDLTEEHWSTMLTSFLEPDNAETCQYMMRTQLFSINTTPDDVQRWINVQLHNIETGEWHDFDLSKRQAFQLGMTMLSDAAGLKRLEPNPNVATEWYDDLMDKINGKESVA